MQEVSALSERARETAGWFETAHRVEGDEDSSFVRTRDGRPEWVTGLIHDAHGDMLPDDWRYRTIWAALDWIAEGNDSDDPGDFADAQVDVYTGARLNWLNSHPYRAGYCNEAADQFGDVTDIIDIIGQGQYLEASEVFGSVLAALEAREEDAD